MMKGASPIKEEDVKQKLISMLRPTSAPTDINITKQNV